MARASSKKTTNKRHDSNEKIESVELTYDPNIAYIAEKSLDSSEREKLREKRKHGSKMFPVDCHHWDSNNGPCYNVWHWHHAVEIIHALEGKDLEIFFADRVVRFDAPAIFIVPGKIMHRVEFAAPGKVNHTVFEPSIVELLRYDEAQGNMLLALSDGTIAPMDPIRRGDPGYEQLDHLLDFMDLYAKYKEAGMRLMLKGCILQILGTLYQYGYLNKKPIRRSKMGSSREDRIKELFNYISENYNHPLSIVDVSSRLNVSKQYFCRLFKSLTNVSFVDYLNVIRLNRAAQEIMLSADPINEIAERHGFDSVSYFFKLFKQHFNCTPNAFRQKKGTAGFEPIDSTILNTMPNSAMDIFDQDEDLGGEFSSIFDENESAESLLAPSKSHDDFEDEEEEQAPRKSRKASASVSKSTKSSRSTRAKKSSADSKEDE